MYFFIYLFSVFFFFIFWSSVCVTPLSLLACRVLIHGAGGGLGTFLVQVSPKLVIVKVCFFCFPTTLSLSLSPSLSVSLSFFLSLSLSLYLSLSSLPDTLLVKCFYSNILASLLLRHFFLFSHVSMLVFSFLSFLFLHMSGCSAIMILVQIIGFFSVVLLEGPQDTRGSRDGYFLVEITEPPLGPWSRRGDPLSLKNVSGWDWTETCVSCVSLPLPSLTFFFFFGKITQ